MYRKFMSSVLFGLVTSLATPVVVGEDYEKYETARRAYIDGDYQTALGLFKSLAKSGDPDAQFSLGLMYDNGLGVTKDHERAEYWFNKACPIPATVTGEDPQDR